MGKFSKLLKIGGAVAGALFTGRLSLAGLAVSGIGAAAGGAVGSTIGRGLEKGLGIGGSPSSADIFSGDPLAGVTSSVVRKGGKTVAREFFEPDPARPGQFVRVSEAVQTPEEKAEEDLNQRLINRALGELDVEPAEEIKRRKEITQAFVTEAEAPLTRPGGFFEEQLSSEEAAAARAGLLGQARRPGREQLQRTQAETLASISRQALLGEQSAADRARLARFQTIEAGRAGRGASLNERLLQQNLSRGTSEFQQELDLAKQRLGADIGAAQAAREEAKRQRRQQGLYGLGVLGLSAADIFSSGRA